MSILRQTGVVWSDLRWQEIVPRVVLFAHSLLRRRPFAGVESSPEDLVWSAIEKTISGRRQWDVERTGIIEHLMGVVSSDLYNNIRKRAAVSMESLYESAAEEIASEAPSPEDSIINKSEALHLLAFLKEKDTRLAELASLSAVFGASRPSELAELMNTPIEDIYLLKKRLRRALGEYLAHQSNLASQ